MLMKKILRRHHISFKNAFSGLWWAITTQPNFRVHIALSIIALFLCWFFRVSPIEGTIIVFTVVLGLSAELVNTALEAMTDLITSQWRKEAKIAKDVAAGMMLTVAFGALIVAALILGPKLMLRLGL